ncbi:MAG: ABC transporter substrate-binding protein [Propionibacteriaceae bacterium]|nr:ABC transporter substrate-binding protein [Propionibacteriaceae bacterium]
MTIADHLTIAHPSTKQHKSFIAWWALVTCLLVVSLAGCGAWGGGTPTPTADQAAPTSADSSSVQPGTTAPATAVPPSPGPQTNPVSRDGVVDGGSFSLGVPAFPSSWNPWSLTPFQLNPVLDAMTPRFFATAADGTLHWDATWLTGQPVVVGGSTPGFGPPVPTMTVTYNLNPKAAWNDGTLISVADFQATWQACVAEPGPACADRGFDHVTAVDQGNDSHQVVVTYDTQYASWPYTFARGPFRAAMVSADVRDQPWTSLVGTSPDFSGPYVVSSSKQSTVTLTRNPRWWGATPKLDTITVSVVADADIELSYLRQDIDGFWVTDPNLFSQASTLSGIVVRRNLGADARFLVMNCAQGPLSDPIVRQAVLSGLDRDEISQSDLAGLKPNVPALDSVVWRSAQPQYVDQTLQSKTSFDPATAKALLDQAGWVVANNGFRSRLGVDLTWDFLIPQGDSLVENEAFNLRVQLAAIGVRLTLNYVDPSTLADLESSGQYAMTVVTQSYTTPAAAGQRYATGNQWGYSNSDVDALAKQALSQTDSSTQADILDQLATAVWQDVPVLPLYEVPETLMVRDGLANYGPDDLGSILWENVGWVS